MLAAMDDTPPDSADRGGSALERAIRACAVDGRYGDAVTLAIEGYGRGLLGFLYAFVPDDEVHDLFSELSMKLWQRLPTFRWQSTFRTWSYAIARNLALDARRRRDRERGRNVPLADAPEVAAIAAAVRSTTLVHLRSESERQLDALRESLDPDDRTLLILVLDRGMTWREVAEVMADESADDAELVRLSARMRKRFERLKDRLREQLRAMMPRT
jgi:RNA polymerase sigma-70 factor (ECF subfamily)